MQVYIVKKHYDWEGFEIDSIYASEEEADARAANLEANSKLPSEHEDHEFAGDRVSVDCYEVEL